MLKSRTFQPAETAVLIWNCEYKQPAGAQQGCQVDKERFRVAHKLQHGEAENEIVSASLIIWWPPIREPLKLSGLILRNLRLCGINHRARSIHSRHSDPEMGKIFNQYSAPAAKIECGKVIASLAVLREFATDHV